MKLFLKILKSVAVGLLAVIVLIVCIILIARLVKSVKSKIKTDSGICENQYVKLGGIEQFIQIRGEDVNNQVIIFLHGGPGNTMTPTAYSYQLELESEYTFVNWDQRGSGRTYYKNPNLDVKTELSTEILVNDLNDLVDYINEKLNKDKVIIMGHSWGSLIGSEYIIQHPEKVSRYIGIGQVVSLKDGYVYSAKEAIKKANEAGDDSTEKRLKIATEVFENTSTLKEFDFNNFMKMQQYSMKYNSYEGEISTPKMLWRIITSPHLTLEDIKWFFKSSNPDNLIKLQEPLLQDCFFCLNLNDFGNKYEVPVNYITGECDVSTPAELLKPYYNNMEAPEKTLTIIPNTGHLPFIDNPKEFAKVLRGL